MEWRPINTFVRRLVKDTEVMGRESEDESEGAARPRAGDRTPFLHCDS